MSLSIRPATLDDAAAVRARYAHEVTTEFASYECQPPDTDEMRRRMAAVLGVGYPWLIAEDHLPGRWLDNVQMQRALGAGSAEHPFHEPGFK